MLVCTKVNCRSKGPFPADVPKDESTALTQRSAETRKLIELSGISSVSCIAVLKTLLPIEDQVLKNNYTLPGTSQTNSCNRDLTGLEIHCLSKHHKA